MTFEFEGVRIILNKKLLPLQMKEKGFINGMGRKIVQEVEVSEVLYNQLLMELEK